VEFKSRENAVLSISSKLMAVMPMDSIFNVHE